MARMAGSTKAVFDGCGTGATGGVGIGATAWGGGPAAGTSERSTMFAAWMATLGCHWLVSSVQTAGEARVSLTG